MKICIMGSAPSSRNLGPFGDDEWTVWACSPPNHDLPRVDAWFELHNIDRKWIPKNGPYLNVLATHPRVFVIKKDARIPGSIEFPWEHYAEKYPAFALSSSIGWMLAHAIEHKPEKIGLWGVDMSASEEYGHQRSGCQFFFWYMKNYTDIKLTLPPTCDVNQDPPLYGVKEQWPMWQKFRAREKELGDRLHKAESAMEHAEKDLLCLRGALDDLRYNENTWLKP